MNLQRGSRRVFVIATILWASACLFWLPYKLRQLAADHFLARYQVCKSPPQVDPISGNMRQDCFASAERDFHRDTQKATWPRFYIDNWKLLLILVLGAPLLPYLVASLFFWMYRGFSKTA
jgi:hypothetical protein